MDSNKQIKPNIAYLRALRGRLSQKAVSDATGIGPKTISALETGASKGIEFATLAKLCAFFHCTPNDILILEDVPDETPPTDAALSKAKTLIAESFEEAIRQPERSPAQIWAEFDRVRARLQDAVEKRQERTASD